jgi:hypothetical protein
MWLRLNYASISTANQNPPWNGLSQSLRFLPEDRRLGERDCCFNHKMDFYLTTSASTFPRIKITWPLSCVHEKFSRRLRVTFKWFVFYFEPKWYTRGFFLPNGTNIVNISIGTILQWSTLGYCNLNTCENEEVAFIGQTSGEPLKWRQFDEISKDTISKIKYTALLQNFMKLGWNLL